jgi:ribosomal protein S7
LEEPVSSDFTLKDDAKKAASSTILFLAFSISSDKFGMNPLQQMVVVTQLINPLAPEFSFKF